VYGYTGNHHSLPPPLPQGESEKRKREEKEDKLERKERTIKTTGTGK
jgi:hypothetical protein